MDKKKIILTSLASVAMLGSAFIASQPSVVKAAEETTAQNEILANFDQALEETIKELEEEAKNDPGSAESIKETIAKLKAEAAKERAKIEDGFKTGKTAEATENEIEEIAKKEEAEEEEAAKAEEAAQKEFLANFDKALEDAIAELKKADTQNNPELAKQVAEAITKLKAEAAKQKKEIEDGFKNGLTVEEAEKAIDDANKKAAEEVKAEAEAKAKQDEFLANYDKALEEAVKELEKAETNSPEEAKAKADTIAALKAASDATRKQIVEGFEKGLTVEEAEKLIDKANEKAAEEDKEAAAKEKTAQDEFLANYDKALEEAVKELEKAETNSPEEAKAKADTIAALKAASDATRKQIVEGFEKGLTAKQAEELIDKANEKAAEEDKEAAAKEEAAQKEFLANYDAALKAAIAELEKADTNSPEEAKAKADTIAALKAASNQTREEIVEGFKKGLTAKQAEELIDKANEKAAEEDKEAAAKEEAAQKEFLANYDAALKAAIAELEKAETKNDPELEKQKQEVIEKLKEEVAKKRSDFVKRFKEGLTAKEAEKELDAANKKAEETTNPAPAEENKPAEQPKSEKGEALVQEELPEYPEIKKVGDSTGSPTKEEGRQSDNTAVNEPALVPKTPSASGIDASATPTAETPSTPAVAPTVAGTNKDNTYQAPAAKAEDKKELPNTGGKDNAAVASLGFLGLLLGALPFVKRKN